MLSAFVFAPSVVGIFYFFLAFSAAKFFTGLRFTLSRNRLLFCAHSVWNCNLASDPLFNMFRRYDAVVIDAARPVARLMSEVDPSQENGLQNSSIFFTEKRHM